MNKKELKAALRPLIKECIKEVMFEDGVLSSIIKEVVVGTSAQVVTEAEESRAPAPTRRERISAGRPDPVAALEERKKKLLGAIGAEAYNGMDLFEGTTPSSQRGNTVEGKFIPDVLGDDATDAGIDISNLFASAGHSWDMLAKGNKK